MRMVRELEELLGHRVDVVKTSSTLPTRSWKLYGTAGLRVVLAHHYHRVDPNQVWVVLGVVVAGPAEMPVLAATNRQLGGTLPG
jgi:uncharacterized protein with HEPN domain